jgi:hypothetical protein
MTNWRFEDDEVKDRPLFSVFVLQSALDGGPLDGMIWAYERNWQDNPREVGRN